ncbi:hypothetical protein [Actinomadura mexicana]|uniref:Lipoprotein n=1 Tax=Actinomadura mexicana TaxID=134959 RepID=A0A239GZC4_9ACTN|nr:hypothetical protein [Actinomadura mexicana]SNS74569.1 hypothetical protein SAMN06265355_12735 [Actinomadura mexicana]
MRMKSVVAAGAVVAIAAAGCGGGKPSSTGPPPPSSSRTPATGGGRAPAPVETESNPPGDIPDNTAFVPFRPAGGRYEVTVPEGWARTGLPTGAGFTDKLNSVRVEVVPASTAPTVRSARDSEAPKIKATKMTVVRADSVQRKGGTAVRLVYRFDSAPDPVTGKVVRDEAERYEFFKAGHEAVLTLSGPVGADNVDPWRTVSDSFRWLP